MLQAKVRFIFTNSNLKPFFFDINKENITIPPLFEKEKLGFKEVCGCNPVFWANKLGRAEEINSVSPLFFSVYHRCKNKVFRKFAWNKIISKFGKWNLDLFI